MTPIPEDPRAIFEDMFRRAFDPALLVLFDAIREVADCDIPSPFEEPFLRFHAFITDPQPDYVTAWRANPRLERKWYHAHVNGILGDVHGALAAARYHASRLRDLETQVIAILEKSDFRERMGDGTIGLGGTRKIDIEYHAFILACRRCLDYLSGALCCYFKTESNSFRTLPRAIAKSKSPVVAAALITVHGKHEATLQFVLAEGRGSVRNRIAHYNFESAGCINLKAQGFFLAGGGEALRPNSSSTMPLSEAVDRRLEAIHECVKDMLDSFIATVRAEA